MTHIIFRQLQTADLQSLSALSQKTYLAAFRGKFDEDLLSKSIARTRTPEVLSDKMREDIFFGAFSGPQLVGYSQVGQIRFRIADIQPGPASLGLEALYVDASFMRMGIGRQLLQATIQDYSSRSIYLNTWDGNYGAKRLYFAHGFRQIGVTQGRTVTQNIVMKRDGISID
jgi:ribosomal protein S18 acetylase RimI-like enzyme